MKGDTCCAVFSFKCLDNGFHLVTQLLHGTHSWRTFGTKEAQPSALRHYPHVQIPEPEVDDALPNPNHINTTEVGIPFISKFFLLQNVAPLSPTRRSMPILGLFSFCFLVEPLLVCFFRFALLLASKFKNSSTSIVVNQSYNW